MAGGLALAAALPAPRPAVAGLLNQFFATPAKLTSPITPNDEFYLTSYRSPPTIRVEDWVLSVKGLVEKPFTLTYSELVARPTVSEIVTLECIGNGVAGEAIGTAEWAGASLKAILDEAGVSRTAFDVVFRAADGYSDSFPVERAMVGDVLVAHRMNGDLLPFAHGFPARIIVPGIYGMKNVQWLTEIELVDQDYQGYYEKKGWSNDATIKTMSRIDLPGHGETLHGRNHTIKGLALPVCEVSKALRSAPTTEKPGTLRDSNPSYRLMPGSFGTITGSSHPRTLHPDGPGEKWNGPTTAIARTRPVSRRCGRTA
jgi:DMSO/TMAO reductase YedYZ molybdopterin-dependent catalytic subunit